MYGFMALGGFVGCNLGICMRGVTRMLCGGEAGITRNRKIRGVADDLFEY
jgi:hypothetical protein